MFEEITKIRVIYADTDKMGFVYYGNYAKFYEIGRTEMMRKVGMAYSEVEEQGIAMPVRSMNINYIKPAFYDDLLTIKTVVTTMPVTRMKFFYEIYKENEELINKAETELIFWDMNKKKPTTIPSSLKNKIERFFR